MEIRSTASQGQMNVELYSDDGYYLYTLPLTEHGYQIPDWLMEEQFEKSKERLRRIVNKDDDEDKVPEVNPQFVVEMNRRAMGTAKPKKPVLIEPNDPKARYPRPPEPKKPSMFLQPPQKEKYTDPRRVKTPPSYVKDIAKGIITNLIGLGAIASQLPNKQQDRFERLLEREMERAERMRDKNNRRNTRRN